MSSLGSRLFLAGTLFLLMHAPTNGAQPPRLHAANALLIMEQPFPRSNPAGTPIVIYREPGVDRLAAHTFAAAAQALPRYAVSEGKLLLPASRRKGEWVRISYDDAGREGWLRLERGWQVVSWNDYLPGQTVRLLPGLKKEFYTPTPAPARTPADNAPSLQDETLRIRAVDGAWARVETTAGWTGWLRWRDDDGRLTITPWPQPENR